MTESELPGDRQAKPAVAESALPFDMAQVKEVFGRLGPVGPMAVVAGTLPLVGTVAVFYLLGKTDMAAWLRGQQGWGLALFVGAYALFSGAALMNTYAPSLASGFTFGVWTGSLAAMVAVTLASTVVYLVVRRISGTRITDLIAEREKWKAVQDALIGSGMGRTLGIVFLIRLSSSPFAVTNLVLGAIRVNVVAYVVGTILGFAPRTVAAVAVGASLSQWDPNAKSRWLIVAGIVVTVIVLGILGSIANQAVQRVTAAQPKCD